VTFNVYIDFYIDIETNKLHQFGCSHIPNKNRTYLGIYKNEKVALMHAKSKGFINASICNSCNI